MTRLTGWRITSGTARGTVLRLDEPVSFWGGIGPDGTIIDVHHPQHGETVTGRILLMRSGRGSSSGTYVLAELLRLGLAPAGIVLTEPDGIIATGALVAAELYGYAMPVASVSPEVYDHLRDGMLIDMRCEGDTVILRRG